MPQSPYNGSCLCGGVNYTISGEVRDIIACHCDQCRKSSGNYVVASACDENDLQLNDDSSLSWYNSSDIAKRGFCQICGSQLFWKRFDSGSISIMAGTLDNQQGLKIACHIYTDSANEFHQFHDHDQLYAKDKISR